MSTLEQAKPMKLSDIDFGSLVLVDTAWRRVERWERCPIDGGGMTGWRVVWTGSLYPSLYLSEPSWLVWIDDQAPRTLGVAG